MTPRPLDAQPPADIPDRDALRAELILQLQSEMKRGLSVLPDPEWNAAALEFLAGPSLNPAGLAAAGVAGTAPGARVSGANRPAGGSSSAGSGAEPGTGPSDGQAPGPKRAQEKKHPTFGPPPPAEGRDRDWERQLEQVRAEARACVACPLHETRTKVVVDAGSGKVPLVFVGEAPGADEDVQGVAFVGRAGQLLTKIIAAIGLDRQDTYICNVIKCRPPSNRNPLPLEIETCSPFLRRQLEILKPRVICTLGLFATQLLLDSKAPIGKLRGRLFRYQGIPLIPTYHPRGAAQESQPEADGVGGRAAAAQGPRSRSGGDRAGHPAHDEAGGAPGPA